MMPLDKAIQELRNDPQHARLVQDAYLGADTLDSAERFYQSPEFRELLRLIDKQIKGATILDLGAGVGIASYAFVKSGAKQLVALEPDKSDLVGTGAMKTIIGEAPINPVAAYGEGLPFADAEFDIVYARQVLHHTANLPLTLKEIARVLKPKGLFIACREPIVRDANDLQVLLAQHPVHQLAGGENAFKLEEYLEAIYAAHLTVKTVMPHFGSVINYWPQSQESVERYIKKVIYKKYGLFGRFLARLPFFVDGVIQSDDLYQPGHVYSFIAQKDAHFTRGKV